VTKVPRPLRQLAVYGLFHRKIMARRYSGVMHLALFTGFTVLLGGSVLAQLDAYLLKPFGIPFLQGNVYQAFQAILDVFGLVFVLGLGLALYRRLCTKPAHLEPRPQILVILLVLTFLAITGFLLEGLRMALELKPSEPWAVVGYGLSRLIRAALPPDSGFLAYRALWWTHALVAFGLLGAIPYTRLVHMFVSPLNTMVSPARPDGALRTPFNLMQLVEAGHFDVKVGARAVDDFDWKGKLGLAACTNCGRCQEVCPAHATGTALSPRRVVQKLSRELQSGGMQDLLDGVVSDDEVWACTTCGACIQACPVLIHPPNYIIELRRELVSRNRLDRRKTDLLSNLAGAFNPFGFPHTDREAFARQLGVPLLRDRPAVDYVYWIGCAGVYDPRTQHVVRAMVRVLKKAGIRFAILGGEERCVGDPARRLGEEGRFQELAFHNLDTLNRYGVKKIITHCPHCFNTLQKEYAQLGGSLEVVHHSVLIHQLIREGRLTVTRALTERVTLHDSCYIGRFHGEYNAPRGILTSIRGVDLVEMQRTRENSFCCGAGGANYWYEVPREAKMSTVRVSEAQDTEARLLAVECPYCLRMLQDAVTVAGLGDTLKVRDLAEIAADSTD
jgi:Fe-S oxidoreductase